MILYGIHIAEPEIRSILNFAKFICSPNSKTEAHITVRGPYKKRLSKKFIEECNKKIVNTKIYVDGLGNFFDSMQNTVYIDCESNDIESIWMKNGFGYNPHITLYDGNDNDFAYQLYNQLPKSGIEFYFTASELEVMYSSSNSRNIFLTSRIDFDYIKSILNVEFDLFDVINLSNFEKVELIREVLEFAGTHWAPKSQRLVLNF